MEFGRLAWFRSRRLRIAAVLIVCAALVVAAVVVTTNRSESHRQTSGRQRGPAGRHTGATGGSGATGPTGQIGGATGGMNGTGPSGATGSNQGQATGPEVTVPPDPDPDLAKVQTQVDSGSCTWSLDTLDLTARGVVRNLNAVDVVVSIDVTFIDASGVELDTASDLAALGPAGAADSVARWDVRGASVDPPAGALRCEVAIS